MGKGPDETHAHFCAELINGCCAFLVALFLVFTALPMGANHPVVWILAAIGVSGIALYQSFGMALTAPSRSPAIAQHKGIAVLAVMTLLFGALQLVPLWPMQINGLDISLWPTTLSLAPWATALSIMRCGTYLLLFAVVTEIGSTARSGQLLIGGVFIGLFFHAVYALVALTFLGDNFYPWDKTDYRGFATGTFINRNSFATFIGMGVVPGIALSLQSGASGRQRWRLQPFVFAGLTAVLICALFASQSRMGIFATCCGGLTTLVMMLRKRGAHWPLLILTVLLASILIGATALVGGIFDRVLFTASDFDDRLALYGQTLALIKERPLTGFGMDSFPIAFELFHKPDLSVDLVWDKAHSTYLTVWAELGIIAGSLPMIAALILVGTSYRNYQRQSDGYAIPAAAVGVAVLCGIHSLVDFSLEIAANAYLFTAILALGVASGSRPAR